MIIFDVECTRNSLQEKLEQVGKYLENTDKYITIRFQHNNFLLTMDKNTTDEEVLYQYIDILESGRPMCAKCNEEINKTLDEALDNKY